MMIADIEQHVRERNLQARVGLPAGAANLVSFSAHQKVPGSTDNCSTTTATFADLSRIYAKCPNERDPVRLLAVSTVQASFSRRHRFVVDLVAGNLTSILATTSRQRPLWLRNEHSDDSELTRHSWILNRPESLIEVSNLYAVRVTRQ